MGLFRIRQCMDLLEAAREATDVIGAKAITANDESYGLRLVA